VCFASALSAQKSSKALQAGIQTTAEIVKIDCSVLDHKSNFVGGLTQNRFVVSDNGIEQPILFFAPVEAPAQVLVMIETSPAVYLIRAEHLTAAFALLEGLSPGDEVALVSYSQAPRAILPFTNDKAGLAAALRQIQFTLGMGDLNLFDSVSMVLDWISPLQGKKAIVLLSTGLDSSPPERGDALTQKLRRDDAVVFTVALGGSLRQLSGKKKKPARQAPKTDNSAEPANPVSFAKADAALKTLAKITGGRAYFPESSGDFVPIYREIAAVLRHQYMLGIAPQHDGAFHSLTVRVLEASEESGKASAKSADYQIFAREGYLAPAR